MEAINNKDWEMECIENSGENPQYHKLLITKQTLTLDDIIAQSQCSDRIFGNLHFDDLIVLGSVSRLWNEQTESKIVWESCDIDLPSPPNALSSNKLAQLQQRCPKKLLYMRQKRIIQKWSNAHELPVKRIDLGIDVEEVKLVHTRDGRFIVAFSDGQIKVWDVNSMQCTIVFPGHPDGELVHVMIVSEDNRMLVSMDENFDVIVWDLINGDKLFCMDDINGWRFSTDCTMKLMIKNDLLLIYSCMDSTPGLAWVFCLQEGKLLNHFEASGKDAIWDINGKSIVVCNNEGYVCECSVGNNAVINNPIKFELDAHLRGGYPHYIDVVDFRKDWRTGINHFIGFVYSTAAEDESVGKLYICNSSTKCPRFICDVGLNTEWCGIPEITKKLGDNAIAFIEIEQERFEFWNEYGDENEDEHGFTNNETLKIATNIGGETCSILRMPLGGMGNICTQKPEDRRLWNFRASPINKSAKSYLIASKSDFEAPLRILQYFEGTEKTEAKITHVNEILSLSDFTYLEGNCHISPTFLTLVQDSQNPNEGLQILIIDCNSA